MKTSSEEVTDRARSAVRQPEPDGPPVQAASDEPASRWHPNSYLGMLAPATREALLALGVKRLFAPGQVFIREKDTNTDLFVLLDGIVKVTAKGAKRDEFIDVQAKGDTVGELAAINPTSQALPRSATVMAAGDVTALEIGKPDLDAFFAAHYDAAVAMAFMLGGRQRQKLRERLNISGFNATTRLARTLVTLEEKLGTPTAAGTLLDIPLTQAELAMLTVVAGPTVEKALQKLKNDGTILTGYRTITITDMVALRRAGRLGNE